MIILFSKAWNAFFVLSADIFRALQQAENHKFDKLQPSKKNCYNNE